ncbi:MAG: disulfide bond formation protein B [Lautropia sp.]|nr:disulfide bond formation protein B [Lautropia sp.]
MRSNSIAHRRSAVCVILLAWGGVAIALMTQHLLDMQPCPWCILQRIGYLLCGALALLALLLPVRHGGSRLLVGCLFLLIGLSALATLGTALYQHWVAAATDSCAITAADKFLISSGLSMWLPEVFQPTASCAEANADLLGIPYALWSAALATMLFCLSYIGLKQLKHQHPAPARSSGAGPIRPH